MPPSGCGGGRARRRIAIGAALLAAVALGGCELIDEPPNLVNGKRLFAQRCGSCHVLDRAATAGTIGPDLDAAFGRARADGLGESTIRGVVEQQILHPRRGSRMPAGLVTGEDADDVAAYVAMAAAVPGEDRGRLAEVGAGRAGGPPGRRLFTGEAGCGSCHTLADAGTAGTSGPDLDQALQGRAEGFIRQSIVDPDAAIAEGFQAGVMPRDYGERLSRRELRQLVEYLADVAG
ncbi:MAG: c-type cytochrome [Solirubrobacteraceae bacterium]